jgi:hypothetical protein
MTDDLGGVLEFRRLLGPEPDDLEGLDELHTLIEADVEACHRRARVRHSKVVFLEAMEMRPVGFTDTNLAAKILDYEAENGIQWAA